MSDLNSYKSPLRKLITFFEKSRDNWKNKSLKHQKENRRLNKRLRVLETAKKRWKDEAITLRKRLKNLGQTTDALEIDLAESKKNSH